MIGLGERYLFCQPAPEHLVFMCCPNYIGIERKDTRFLHHLSTPLWTNPFHLFSFLQIAPTLSIPQRSVCAPCDTVVTYHPKRSPWYDKELLLVATHWRCDIALFNLEKIVGNSLMSLLVAGAWMKICPMKYNSIMVRGLRLSGRMTDSKVVKSAL